MQIKKLVPPLTEQWKAIYEKERPNLTPNAITGEAIADYVQSRYQATPITEEAYLDAIKADVRNDAFFSEKLHGAEPRPAAFRLPDGTFVGIDLVSGWFIAENDAVHDELTYVKGLDEADLANVIRTADWLRCQKSMSKLKKKGYIRSPKKPFRKHDDMREKD